MTRKNKLIRITIHNEAEYQQFLHDLRRYRTPFFSYAKFEITSTVHAKRTEDVCRALNIKKRMERISFIYDRACDIIDEYNKEKGICCNYKNGYCEDPKHQRHKNGCCFLCHLQKPFGCPTKNISCKLFYCDHMVETHPVLMLEQIDLLKMFTPSQMLIVKENAFVSRETHLKLLWLGSYLLYCMFSVSKLFRMKNI